jgi:hypothetical protein
MKKTNALRPKRLTVRRETVAQLTTDQLPLIAGGFLTDGCISPMSKRTAVCHTD